MEFGFRPANVKKSDQVFSPFTTLAPETPCVNCGKRVPSEIVKVSDASPRVIDVRLETGPAKPSRVDDSWAGAFRPNSFRHPKNLGQSNC